MTMVPVCDWCHRAVPAGTDCRCDAAQEIKRLKDVIAALHLEIAQLREKVANPPVIAVPLKPTYIPQFDGDGFPAPRMKCW